MKRDRTAGCAFRGCPGIGELACGGDSDSADDCDLVEYGMARDELSERVVSGRLVFIPGFLDNAALWQGVIDRLVLPGWDSVPINLRGTDHAQSSGPGATLEAYRDQVLDVLDRLDRKAARPRDGDIEPVA